MRVDIVKIKANYCICIDGTIVWRSYSYRRVDTIKAFLMNLSDNTLRKIVVERSTVEDQF